MTKTRHTPAPWTHANGQVNSERGTVCNTVSVNELTPIKLLERDANARLIAAAPELLEALLRVREAFYVKGTKKALQAALESTHAAIAKAKGLKS